MTPEIDRPWLKAEIERRLASCPDHNKPNLKDLMFRVQEADRYNCLKIGHLASSDELMDYFRWTIAFRKQQRAELFCEND